MAVLFREIALVAGAAFADGVACAEWTAAVLVTGARIDDGLPGVTIFALPPNFAPAAREDLIRSEGRVFGWVPFGGYARIFCGEIVEAWEHLGIGAVWAAAVALGAAGDGGLILVAFVADPPDFAPGAGDDISWGEVAVFGWVPLASELGIVGGEVVDAAQECAIAADWAASAGDAAFDLGAPLVAMRTLPPNEAMAAREHVRRGEIAVFGWMPFGGEIWVTGYEVCFAGDWQTT